MNEFLTIAPGVTLDLVCIPAGEFLMGSTDSDTQATNDEKPQHKVMLDEYQIGKYEVTNAQFAAFVKGTGFETRAEEADSDGWKDPQAADWQHPWGPNSDLIGRDNYPVVWVSWGDAVAFCAWASQTTGRQVRLLTEAEWEKAAHGTDGRIYPWGNEAPNAKSANFNMIYNTKVFRDTTEVGKYSPAGDSPYGLADMAGNVWEWTADWYSDTYYASSPASNPQGPTTGKYRVVRGGPIEPSAIRAACRMGFSNIDMECGFRVAVSAPVPSHA